MSNSNQAQPPGGARITRREAIALATGVPAAGTVTGTAGAAPAPAAGGTPLPADAVQLVLAQRAWDATTAAVDVERAAAIAVALAGAAPHTLLLLPRAEPPGPDVPAEATLVGDLGGVAQRHRVWIAGAAPVRTASGVQTIGLVIAPDGVVILRAAKATPDVFDGFTDTAATLGAVFDFTAVATPFGKLGLLVGEDLLVPGLVRGTMLAGAELLLAPSAGHGPGTAESLAELPTAVAYENWCAVAVATPLTRRTGGAAVAQATRSGLFDLRGLAVRAAPGEEFCPARFEVESVRLARARVSPDLYDNFPVWLRAGLFGNIFAHQAAGQSTPPGPTTRAGWLAEAERRIARQATRKTPLAELADYYMAFVAQPATMASLPVENRRETLVANIDTALGVIGRIAAVPNARLALFPEFCFSGAGYRNVPDMLGAAVTLPGPEMARLQQFARDNSIWCAAQFLEADPQFPGRAFNTAILLDDRGDLVLKHRKLQCVDIMGALPDTTPGSIYDDYVAAYGIESLYAIADTPLGKLGLIVCFEINLPEIVRAMAREGVEVILHLTAEGYGCDRAMWQAQRRKRAFENQAYLLSSNQAWDVARKDLFVPYGESQFIDFRGRERDRLAANGPGMLIASLDLAALRAARRDPRFNFGIWDEPAAYAAAYQRGGGVPNNLWLGGDPGVSPYVGTRTLEAVRDAYYAAGTYVRPQRR
jgi:predicted amidohydrolase